MIKIYKITLYTSIIGTLHSSFSYCSRFTTSEIKYFKAIKPIGKGILQFSPNKRYFQSLVSSVYFSLISMVQMEHPNNHYRV